MTEALIQASLLNNHAILGKFPQSLSFLVYTMGLVITTYFRELL